MVVVDGPCHLNAKTKITTWHPPPPGPSRPHARSPPGPTLCDGQQRCRLQSDPCLCTIPPPPRVAQYAAAATAHVLPHAAILPSPAAVRAPPHAAQGRQCCQALHPKPPPATRPAPAPHRRMPAAQPPPGQGIPTCCCCCCTARSGCCRCCCCSCCSNSCCCCR